MPIPVLGEEGKTDDGCGINVTGGRTRDDGTVPAARINDTGCYASTEFSHDVLKIRREIRSDVL